MKEAALKLMGYEISQKILSIVEKYCQTQKINKKGLAKLVGVSPSHITQLFRGNKMVNTDIMMKFQVGLGFTFVFSLKTKSCTNTTDTLENRTDIRGVTLVTPSFYLLTIWSEVGTYLS